MQYIYHRFGRDRAGLSATVISYRTRGACAKWARPSAFRRM